VINDERSADGVRLLAYASGGNPPYRYKLSLDGKEVKLDEPISKDGWFRQELKAVTQDVPLNLQVTDSRDLHADKDYSSKASSSPNNIAPINNGGSDIPD